ncbi:oxidoreductase [Deinococcus humi]|uniref:Probable oxidoreductase n=1 Tax=Deinococcus humi TaxID=662880 RepID=A0A7W8NBM1_9DEIO|nr:oxidoreductase [Deinococcus humi]MBB5361259.1 NAD(P)-dependent dehydrogenase (short-subunit alcohol dehydrogenase family) [Deinococcus humi]GGO19196.1 oxidoreductase [Deinococcus humi]
MTTIASPLAPRATALEVIQGIDLGGKTAVITGASSGIGVETARALLWAGASMILAVRDPAKGEKVAAELSSSTGNHKVQVIELDLGSLAQVREGAGRILAAAPAIHILINNAGIMATPKGRTPEGFELQFGTNHLGHFLLTDLLMPALLAAAPARVVALTSSGHRRSDIVWDDIQFESRPYDRWEAYGQSKTANALFAVGLTQQYGARGVTANAVHPGGIMTGLQKFVPLEEQRAMGWQNEAGELNPVFKTTEEGASTTVWAATSPQLQGVGGLFLEDLQESTPLDPQNPDPMFGHKPYTRDSGSAARLWTLSESLVSGYR